MAIQQSSLDDGWILRYAIIGEWSAQDLFSINSQSKTLLDTLDHQVQLLIDMRAAKGMPGNLLDMRTNPEFGHPRTDQIVILGAGFMLKMALQTGARLMGANNMHFYDKEEDALRFLREYIRKHKP
jgi:hypothetical protein